MLRLAKCYIFIPDLIKRSQFNSENQKFLCSVPDRFGSQGPLLTSAVFCFVFLTWSPGPAGENSS